MINKTKFLVLSVFALFAIVMISSLGAAATCLDIKDITVPTNVEHDAGTFPVSFTLAHDSGCSTDRTGITWDFSSNIVGMGWTTPTLVTLDADDTATINVVFNFPEHKTGNINLVIKVDSNQDDEESFNLMAIPINNKAEFSLEKSGILSATSQGSVLVNNDGNVPLNIKLIETSVFGAMFNGLSSINLPTLAPGAISGNVEVSIPASVKFRFGDNNINIKAEDVAKGVSETISFTKRKTFCTAGSVGGNLEFRDIEIDNQGEGDDNEWQLLDMIEIEVEVENNGNEDIDDVIVEMALFDSSGDDITGDLEFENDDEEEIDLGDLDEDDEDTVIFKFMIPADVDDGNYKLAIKAYGDKLGEDVECVDTSNDLSDDFFEKISIDRETDEGKFIAFQDIVVSPLEASCGEEVTLTADVYNIGDGGKEEQVRVNLLNSELGFSLSEEIRNDLDEGDKESVSFNFMIPRDAKDGTYVFRMSADYDYKRGSYRESSDEDKLVNVKVLGCGTPLGLPTGGNKRIAAINAVLDSSAMAGESLVVRATITSLKSESAAFVVDALSFQSWASLDDISSRTFVLGAGESKDVTFTLSVDDDAAGEESFIIEVSSGSEFEAREIAVNIKGTGGSPKTGSAITGLGDNAYLWIIGVVNVILVILIIIVAVRISRR